MASVRPYNSVNSFYRTQNIQSLIPEKKRTEKRLVWDKSNFVGAWICDRIGGAFDPYRATAIGYERNGLLIAGCMFDHFNNRAVWMHVAGHGNFATKEFLGACFKYVFNQLGVIKAIAPVDSTNLKSRKFVEHLGFQLESTIKDAGNIGDVLIYTMTRQQCRWME